MDVYWNSWIVSIGFYVYYRVIGRNVSQNKWKIIHNHGKQGDLELCCYEGFDFKFKDNVPYIEEHFCENKDCEGGLSFEQAKTLLIAHYEVLISKLNKCPEFDEYLICFT